MIAIFIIAGLFWAGVFLAFTAWFYRSLHKVSQKRIASLCEQAALMQYRAMEAARVLSTIPFQEIAAEMGLTLGEPIAPCILPYLQQVKSEREVLRMENQHLLVHLSRFPHGMDCSKFSRVQ